MTWLSGKSGLASEIAVRILRAYFSEGQNISNIDTLIGLAEETGLDAEETRDFLQSGAGSQEVRSLEQQAIARGIHSIPTIRIGDETVSGAQSVEALVAVLKRATLQEVS